MTNEITKIYRHEDERSWMLSSESKIEGFKTTLASIDDLNEELGTGAEPWTETVEVKEGLAKYIDAEYDNDGDLKSGTGYYKVV